ncbi:amidohydrolase family protein [candidate division KSB1 bacterium]
MIPIQRIMGLGILLLVVGFVFGCGPTGSGDDSMRDRLLLSDWEPASEFLLPETEVVSARYPAIDLHCHDYGLTPEGVKDWVTTMDEVGIEQSAILSMIVGARFDSLVEMYGAYPDRFQLWCGLDFTGFDKDDWSQRAIRELERCAAAGAIGVGELGDKGTGLWGGPVYGLRVDRVEDYRNALTDPKSKYVARGLHPDDPKLKPVFARCAELGLPVNLHVADPIWMYKPIDKHNEGLWGALDWQVKVVEGMKGHEAMIEVINRACASNPRTKFVACHNVNLSHDLARLGRLLDEHANLYVDISARFNLMASTPRQAKKILIRHQDRFVYGTDMGRELEMYRWTLRILETDDEHFYRGGYRPLHGINLPAEVLKKLYRDNAVKILAM